MKRVAAIFLALSAAGCAQSTDKHVRPRVLESDLRQLAYESGKGCELFFFPRLRDEVRLQLQHSPQLLRFRGLRSCVKQLTGARRWSPRCQTLHDQIVEFLRNCFATQPNTPTCALLVE